MMSLASALLLASSAALVAGHGFVTSGTIGGTNYTFYQPYTDPYTSPAPKRISRPIQGNGPVTDVSLKDIQCGGYTAGGIEGSTPAALHAPVKAGSDVNLIWTTWPESHFGALVTYMARCPESGCQDWQPGSDAVWFKIAEEGLIDKSKNTWATTSLIQNPAAGYTYTVPSCLTSGKYLVRHEIIAVFVANVEGGVQVYPSCHQLEVTSSGSATPGDLVSFPGAYSPTDPGILWDSSKPTYPIPGPEVFSCGADSGNNGGSSGSSPVSTTKPAATTTPETSASSATPVASDAVSFSSAVNATPTTLVTATAAASTQVDAASASTASPTADSTSASASAAAPSATDSCKIKKRRAHRRSRRAYL